MSDCDDNCCNGDCTQGRNCPHKTSDMGLVDEVVIAVLLLTTSIVSVCVMWWIVTAIFMIDEVIK